MFERSLEKKSLMEEIKQKQEVMDRKLDALLQEREDGAGADASGRRKAELPGELEWPLQTPEDAEKKLHVFTRVKRMLWQGLFLFILIGCKSYIIQVKIKVNHTRLSHLENCIYFI